MSEKGTIAALNVNVLILEDVPADAELELWALRKSGLIVTAKIVADKASFIAALEEFKPDILLTDFKLPDFDGLSAIKLAHEKFPNLPIVVVTGALGDESAVELIKAGAVDYILKDRLARLPGAVQKALFEAEKSVQLVAQTAIAHAERDRFSIIAESTHDAIVMMNAEGIITFWNGSAERMFGYSEMEAVGRNLHDLLAPEYERSWAHKGVSEFAKTGQGPMIGKMRELTAQRKNGSQFRVELSISAIQLEGKWMAIGLARDVGERPNLVRFG